MKRVFISLISVMLIYSACNTMKKTSTEVTYQRSVENSMYPTARKIYNLVDISKSNPDLVWKTINNEEYVLMLTWKAQNYYPESGQYNTGQYEMWVTAAPELYNKMCKEKVSRQEMRLKQLLGLPPTAQNKIFIEFWVRPADMFRPCPDKEVNDKTCNVCFTAKDSIDAEYIKWFNASRIDRYYASGLYNQYPWTQLGYTYDWNPKNKSHRGLSEFVVGKNKTIYVNRSYTTEEYLRLKK